MTHNHLLAIVVPVLKRGTSLNLRDFQNSPSDTKKAIEDLFVNLLLFLVVAYSLRPIRRGDRTSVAVVPRDADEKLQSIKLALLCECIPRHVPG